MRKPLLVLLSLVTVLTAASLASKQVEKRKVLFENDHVRVKEVFIEPGVDYAPHTHDLPHVGIIIKSGTLQFTEKGKVDTVDFKVGSVGWRDKDVTHSIKNVGKTPVHIVEVELKK